MEHWIIMDETAELPEAVFDTISWKYHVARYVERVHGHRCPTCGRGMSSTYTSQKIGTARSRGHVHSVSRYSGPGAAEHAAASWVYMCSGCNSRQGHKSLHEWAGERSPYRELRAALVELVEEAIADRIRRYGK